MIKLNLMNHIRVILFFFILTHSIYASVLSIESFVQSLLDNNPLVKKQYAQFREGMAHSHAYYGEWDSHYFFDTTYSMGLPPRFSSDFNPDGKSLNSQVSRTKQSRKGVLHHVAGFYGQTTHLPKVFDIQLDDIFQMGFTYTLTKPLLQNAKGNITQSKLKKIELKQNLVRLRFEEDLEEFIYQSLVHYLQWVGVQKRVILLESEHEKAKSQHQVMLDLLADNLVDKQDMLMSKKRLLLTSFALDQELYNLDSKTRYIQALIGETRNIQADTSASFFEEVMLDNEALLSTRPFKIMDLLTKDYHYSKTIAEESKKRKLALHASVSAVGYGDSTSSMMSDFGKSNQYSLKVTGDFSGQSLTASANITSAIAALDVHLNDVTNLKTSIAVQFSDLKSLYHLYQTYIRKQDAIVELSQSIEKLEDEAYSRAQRQSLITVIDAQRIALQDQLQAIEYDSQKHLCFLGLLQLTDQLLDKVFPQ